MKKIALLFILGTISLGFFAQNYVPFPSSNASWIDIVSCDEHHYELVGDQNATLQVFDVSGRLGKEQQLSTTLERQQLDVSHLNNGVYHFLVTLKGERLFNGKLVLTK